MNPCPLCGYQMSAFDTICPRCKGQGVAPKLPITSPTAPQIPPPVVSLNPTPPRKIGFGVGLLLVLAGGVIGLYIGDHIGEYIDTKTLERFGESRLTKPHYFYWSIRFSVVGVFLGWIAGAIFAYLCEKLDLKI